VVHWWRVFRVGMVSLVPVFVCGALPLPLLFFGFAAPDRRLLIGAAIGLAVVLACLSLALRVCAAARVAGLVGALRALRTSLRLYHWLALLALSGAIGWLGRLAEPALLGLGYSLTPPRLLAWAIAVLVAALAALWCLALMVRLCKSQEG